MSFYEIAAFFCSLVIGLVMGLIGSGGSILSVPIFVYLFSMDTLQATTYSLFVVGATSFVGTIPYLKKKLVDINHVLYFGVASVIAVVSVRALILPHLPEILYDNGSFVVKKDTFILVLFSILMFLSALKMIKNKTIVRRPNARNSKELLIIQGIGIGVLTGLIGAGGGFLIIPALVLILGLDMKSAIGTSLCIITINSIVGFSSSVRHVDIDWNVLMIFTAISIIGILLGHQINKRVKPTSLKPIFGWFIILIAVFIVIKELVLK